MLFKSSHSGEVVKVFTTSGRIEEWRRQGDHAHVVIHVPEGDEVQRQFLRFEDAREEKFEHPIGSQVTLHFTRVPLELGLNGRLFSTSEPLT